MKTRFVVALSALAALALSACGATATPTAAPATQPAGPDSITIDARLVPQDYVDIAFRASGQVSKVLVTEGDSVSQGQVIAQLDDTDQQQAVNKAQLAINQAQVSVATAQHTLDTLIGWAPNKNQLNSAQATLANAEAAVQAAQAAYDPQAWNPSISSLPQSLALQKATNDFNKAKADVDYLYSTRPDVTQARNNVEAAKVVLSAAQLDLEIANNALDKTTLRAPFSGAVTRLDVRAGSSVTTGQPAATVADLKTWVVETDNLTELEITKIKVGQKVTIAFDALPDTTFHGEVKRIASQFEEKRGDITYTVTISLSDPNADLRWGMTASVNFPQ